jgi:hypothetical protein
MYKPGFFNTKIDFFDSQEEFEETEKHLKEQGYSVTLVLNSILTETAERVKQLRLKLNQKKVSFKFVEVDGSILLWTQCNAEELAPIFVEVNDKVTAIFNRPQRVIVEPDNPLYSNTELRVLIEQGLNVAAILPKKYKPLFLKEQLEKRRIKGQDFAMFDVSETEFLFMLNENESRGPIMPSSVNYKISDLIELLKKRKEENR